MKHIKSYEIFEATKHKGFYMDYNESDFQGNTGMSPKSGFMGWMNNFFQNFADRFDRFDDYYKQNIALKLNNGTTLDTGLGWLIGTVGGMTTQFIADLFKRMPGSKKKSNDSSLPTPKSESEVTPLHQRVYNDSFVKNDLPNIKNDDDMEKYLMNYYSSNGIKPGQSKVADDMAANMAGSYYNTASSPGSKGAGDWLSSIIGKTGVAGAEAEAGAAAAAAGEVGLAATVGEIAPFLI